MNAQAGISFFSRGRFFPGFCGTAEVETVMIRCYQCGTDNLDGSEYCDECGKKLTVVSSSPRAGSIPAPPQLSASNVPPPPSFTNDTIIPKPATPYTPPPPPVFNSGQAGQPSGAYQPPPMAPMERQANIPTQTSTSVANLPHPTGAFNGPTSNLGGGAFNSESGQSQPAAAEVVPLSMATARAKLVIQRGGKVGKEFPLSGSESMIGRWDADGGIFPDVDLDQDDPEAKISRRHARITFLNNQYLIEDLGSTNGTFINRGPRLLPGNKQPLNHGDEIIVGKTFLKFVLS